MSGKGTKPSKYITIENVKYIIVKNRRKLLNTLCNGFEYFTGDGGKRRYPCKNEKCDTIRTRKPRRDDGYCSDNCAEAARGRSCPRCGFVHHELYRHCSLTCANTRNTPKDIAKRTKEKKEEVAEAIEKNGRINFLEASRGRVRDPLDPTRLADPNKHRWDHKINEDGHIEVDTRWWNNDDPTYRDENGVLWSVLGREIDYWDK